MQNRNTIVLILIIVLALLALWIALPIQHPQFAKQAIFWQQPPEARTLDLKQGLDLKGGTQVLLQAQPAQGQTVTPEDMQAAMTIVGRRVNALGVTEPLVQPQGENRIIVELPGVSDPDLAVKTLRSTGQLEFVEIGDADPLITGVNEEENTRVFIRTSNSNQSPDSAAVAAGEIQDPHPDKVYKTLMTGRDLQSAQTGLDNLGGPAIDFVLKDSGKQIFGDYTRNNVGKVVAIVLDNIVLSAPSIREPITEGNGQISGSFPKAEADSISVQMRYGALPVPLEVVSRNSIGATLGADSVRTSITAGLIGLAAVLVFMIVYYRLPGLLAALALVIYALLNLALYKLIPVTLTLPGIAGFLLSTGMAVDANILIFERMREELRWGRTMRGAVEAGFSRAWTSIFDSNLSTIITCIILWIFGNNFGAQAVQGFAFTLGLGVLISMFTAVVVTRTFMRAAFDNEAAEGLRGRRSWMIPV